MYLANGDIQLRYILQGDLKQILIPQKCKPEQKNNLWQHTCFEAFIGFTEETHYYEYNIAPSQQWAIYAFKDYRQQQQYKPPLAPDIQITQNNQQLEINAVLAASTLPVSHTTNVFQIGLSAVIESKDLHKTYWALSHPLEKPDFHCYKGFILQLN
jgi:hypothetical protein